MNRIMLKVCLDLIETGRVHEAHEHLRDAYRAAPTPDAVERFRAIAAELDALSFGVLAGPATHIRKHADAIQAVREKSLRGV